MRRLIVLAAGLVLMACSSTGPSQRVSFSISTQSATTTVGSDVLVINKAEIILRKVELEGQTNGCVADAPTLSGPMADSESDGTDDGEDCEEFKAGPFRLELPLNALEAVVTVDVPAGSYEQVEFQIHKVSSTDADFAAANPEFVGKSIRVEGTFNGQPFVFESDLTAEQEVGLEPPLVVTNETATNLTLRVDLSTWFKTAAGLLVNPSTANAGGVNEQLVKQNIKLSFRAFEDRDRDGEDDD